MRLENRTAIVTGAAHGIGRAIAEYFAWEGAEVFMVDIDTQEGEGAADLIRRQGGRAAFLKCDVARTGDVKRAVKIASAKTRRIDVLCNNAAYIAEKWHSSLNSPDAEWKKSYEVSLLSAQRFTQAVLPFMIKRGSGSIINISSVQGLVAGRSSAAYTTIKHALIGLTRSVACDFGSHNIRCNAICPGAITTRISPRPGSELYRRQISKTFLGRVGRADEVAAAALFLASDEASYVTGAVLAVDGGWTAM